jgi:hypothetical protein
MSSNEGPRVYGIWTLGVPKITILEFRKTKVLYYFQDKDLFECQGYDNDDGFGL